MEEEDVEAASLVPVNESTPLKTQKKKLIYREAFLVVLPLFSGYAALFALQREVKQHIGISDDDESQSRVFGAAVSFLYFGNLIFRLGHNVIFGYLAPRNRVLVSISSMLISILILIFVVASSVKWIGFVFFAYFFGGIGIGTFEANLLNVCTELGSSTKLWAVVAMPVGVVTITIGSFLLLQIGVEVVYIYSSVAIMLVVAIFLYTWRIHSAAKFAVAPSVAQFIADLKEWFLWFPPMKFHCLVMMVNMFCVALLSPGVLLYIYDTSNVKVSPTSWILPKDVFFAIYNTFFFLGDTSGRKVFYRIRTLTPLLFLSFSLLGCAFAFSTLPLIIPLGAFFVAFGNGSLYAQSCRHIDKAITEKFNLISVSFWLFIGDIGSTVGSNMIPYIYEGAGH